MNFEPYMKYAIASESITVEGVRMVKGFNKLTDSQFNKLSRSNFRKRGIYELHDQELEAKQNKEAVKPVETIEVPKDDIDVDVDINPDKVTIVDPETLSYRELVAYAKENGVNTKGLNREKILVALKEGK